MNLLFRVIHASRCTSTHHKLAVDALRHLRGSFAERWRNLFLKHVKVYLDGSKAPDKRFKDFRNHVLHVQDNHWGGAPKAARKWYDLTVRGLRGSNWIQAVYAAGVLSHYYTDPIQPFHTGQSEQENNVHRAAEWSIAKSYDELFRMTRERQGFPQVDVPAGDDWLEQMVIEGAELSHAHYEPLITHYNFERGVRQPQAGLDATCRDFLAQLIGHAQVGFARILDRAVAQARVTPPVTMVTVRGVLASLEIPIRWVTRKITDERERVLIEATYRELKSTGKVERTLAEDDRAVREMHAREVLGAEKAPQKTHQRPAVHSDGVSEKRRAESERSRPDDSDSPQAGTRDTLPHRPYLRYPHRESDESSKRADRGAAKTVRSSEDTGTLRFYLELTSDVVDAPSIGPKTARRLRKLKVRSVADLLRLNPEQAAGKLGARHITPQAIRDWQDQARLVCRIPNLRGHDAQILVACGYTEPGQVAAANSQQLLSSVESFVATSDGQRILRSSPAPDLAEIRDWIRWAQSSRRLDAA